MRSVGYKHCFTDFGLWVRENLKGSDSTQCGGLVVSNIDYVLYDYIGRNFMLLEEKTNNGIIHKGQGSIFRLIDTLLRKKNENLSYNYWGFFVLAMPKGATAPCSGMRLNWKPITEKELKQHLNFEKKFCDSLYVEYPRS